MELVDKAKTSNDFGLRKRFSWTGSTDHKPWTQTVTEDSEISFVNNLLSPVFFPRKPTIWRVENPYLWASYVLAFEELNANLSREVMERHVIHATSLTNALQIADVNFNWRLVNRARFGKGVSFATSATYAKKYASDKDAYIISGIPVSSRTFGGYRTIIPSGDYDTTGDYCFNVDVKYYDSDFYPYYIAF